MSAKDFDLQVQVESSSNNNTRNIINTIICEPYITCSCPENN